MARPIYCAKCGEELNFLLKALPYAGTTVTVVEPHTCLKNTKKNPYKTPEGDLNVKSAKKPKKELDEMFEGFEFAKSLSENSMPTSTVFDRGSTDKRPKDSIRDDSGDLKSTAPNDVLSAVKNSPNSEPENELKE